MKSSPPTTASRARVHSVTFREALSVWVKVAIYSFGGQIAVMHRLLVEEKRWVSENRFLHALNYCMLKQPWGLARRSGSCTFWRFEPDSQLAAGITVGLSWLIGPALGDLVGIFCVWQIWRYLARLGFRARLERAGRRPGQAVYGTVLGAEIQ